MTAAASAAAGHDPLCQRHVPDHWCECALIERVVEREQERLGYATADEIRAAERRRVAGDIAALHSDYDPSGSGDRWHACQDQREHDLLERCEAIARGES